MREDIQRRILEGLPKGDILTRNKNQIKRIKTALESSFLGGTEYGRGSVLWNDFWILFTFELKQDYKIETYLEKDRVVLGIPLTDFTTKIELNMDTTHETLGSYFFTAHDPEGKFTPGQREILRRSEVQFARMFQDTLERMVSEITPSLRITLQDSAYPRYQNREYLPLVSLDFKNNRVWFLRNPRAVSTKDLEAVSLGKDYDVRVVKALGYSHFFPRSLMDVVLVLEHPTVTKQTYRIAYLM